LARLGLRTVGDLLYHAPHRYLDATSVTPLAQAHVGQDVTCIGRVASTGVLPTRKGLRVFRAVLRDDSGSVLECAWPGQPFLERQIKKGQLLHVTGPVRYYHGRRRRRTRKPGAGASRATSCSTSSWCTRARGRWPSAHGRGSASHSRRSLRPASRSISRSS